MNKTCEKKTFKLVILIALVVACAATFIFGTFRVVNAAGGDNTPSVPESSMMTLRSGYAESGSVVLNATVSPVGAEAAGLTWSAAWKNPSSTFAASNADPTKFVRLTPNGTSCTVELIAPFGEQIVITVASNADPNVKASCTVDYLQKITSQKMEFSEGSMGTYNKFEAGKTVPLFPLSSSGDVVEYYQSSISVITTMDQNYTLSCSSEGTVRVKMTDAFRAIAENYLDLVEETSEVSIADFTLGDVFNLCGAGKLVPTSSTESIDYAKWNAFHQALCELGDVASLQIEVTMVTEYGTQVFNYNVVILTDSVEWYVTDVALDQSSIIF